MGLAVALRITVVLALVAAPAAVSADAISLDELGEATAVTQNVHGGELNVRWANAGGFASSFYRCCVDLTNRLETPLLMTASAGGGYAGGLIAGASQVAWLFTDSGTGRHNTAPGAQTAALQVALGGAYLTSLGTMMAAPRQDQLAHQVSEPSTLVLFGFGLAFLAHRWKLARHS